MPGWSYRPILIAALSVAPAVAPDEPSATAGIDARYYPVVRETLDAFRDELLAAEPGLDPAALRSRLHVQALDLINQTRDEPVPGDRLLTLPAGLKADADRLVAESARRAGRGLGPPRGPARPEDRRARPAGGPGPAPRLRGHRWPTASPRSPIGSARAAPTRPRRSRRWNRRPLEVAAQAITTTGRPEDLTPPEADFARATARQIAGGDGAARPSTRRSSRPRRARRAPPPRGRPAPALRGAPLARRPGRPARPSTATRRSRRP